jgi:hypothetical protein
MAAVRMNEERIEAAVKAMEEENPVEETPDVEEEEEEGGEVEEGEESAETASPESPPSDNEMNTRFAILRRKEEALDKKLSGLDDMVSEKLKPLTDRESKLAEREREIAEMAQLMRTNPEQFAKKIAGQAGLRDENDFYERWTHQRLNGGEVTPHMALEEVSRLRAELAERDQRDRDREKQREEASQAQGFQRFVDDHVSHGLSLAQDESMAEAFPNLSVTSPEVLGPRLRATVAHWVKSGSEATYPELLAALDRVLGKEYEYRDKRRGQGTSKKTPAATPETPAPKAKSSANGQKKTSGKRTISNQDQAETPVVRRGRSLSRRSRVDAAAAAMEKANKQQ